MRDRLGRSEGLPPRPAFSPFWLSCQSNCPVFALPAAGRREPADHPVLFHSGEAQAAAGGAGGRRLGERAGAAAPDGERPRHQRGEVPSALELDFVCTGLPQATCQLLLCSAA